MAIQVSNPVTISAEEMTLDSFWMGKLTIFSDDPNKQSRLIANVEKTHANPDGTYTKADPMVKQGKAVLVINELEKTAGTDAQTLTFKSPVTGQDITLYTAEIMLAVTLKIKQMCEQNGLI